MQEDKSPENYEHRFELVVAYDTSEQLQAILEEVTMEESLRCKFCGEQDIVKYGKTPKGVQKYLCKKCQGVFLDNKALPHMRTSVHQLGSILGQYYGGMSFKEIRRQLDQQYNILPSRSTLYRHLTRFTRIAISEAKKHIPAVSNTWIADETVIWVGGRKLWLWDILDLKTRFLLASHLSQTRTIADAKYLMRLASSRAGGIVPRVIITDKLASYVDGIELVFGADTKHIQSSPFVSKDSTNIIERFQGTIKSRTKVMRGLKNKSTARLILDGFFIHYNFFRGHESLKDKTPAEKAGIDFPFKDWLDVVKSQLLPIQQTQGSRDRYIPSSYPYQHSPRRIPRSERAKLKARKQTTTTLSTIRSR